MGYRFNPGWEPDSEPQITPQDLLSMLLQSQAPSPTPPPFVVPPPPPSSVQAIHFGGYIEDMMFGEGYNTINITIQKADKDNLIFKINHKEK